MFALQDIPFLRNKDLNFVSEKKKKRKNSVTFSVSFDLVANHAEIFFSARQLQLQWNSSEL